MKIFKLASLLCFSLSLLVGAEPLLFSVPKDSKIIFKEDFMVPASESSVLIGSSWGNYLTKCHLNLKNYSNGLRKIPKGVEFKVLETREGFGNQIDLIIQSESVSSITCTSAKPWREDQPIPENYLSYTTLKQAKRAFGHKIELELNDQEPLLIKN